MRNALAAAVALVLVVPVAGCAGSRIDLVSHYPDFDDPALAPADGEIRVMSFNLRTPFLFDAHNHWSFRKDDVVRVIRAHRPDILGTQECPWSSARYLIEHLPEYEFVGAGRDDGRARGEMCAIWYRKDKFIRLDEGHFWLSETPDVPGSDSWGSAFTRMVSWVELLPTQNDGQSIFFFNTHFDSGSGKARRRSAALLRSRMAKIAGPYPVIVTGDFNADEDSRTYDLLLAGLDDPEHELADTYRQRHPQRSERERTRHGFGGRDEGDRIDWILANHSFVTRDARIIRARPNGRYPSDHFPVTAVLQLLPRTAAAPADVGVAAVGISDL